MHAYKILGIYILNDQCKPKTLEQNFSNAMSIHVCMIILTVYFW